jgi:hypothetical protein
MPLDKACNEAERKEARRLRRNARFALTCPGCEHLNGGVYSEGQLAHMRPRGCMSNERFALDSDVSSDEEDAARGKRRKLSA